ncbi:sel1 repeat family protein [Virgisporangium ochraceum]|uniref:Sel1 repeat family protein n=1 Tax=Virgisporangium ochraceum TaxID=65505 RepID=A0A8J4A5H3_9ACTN|nr:sel1 repeat family protein [Virgisporangium ochraceum]GIJ75466.1 hypothetical protein Voc01_103830 [Virgisporangium ochraceum]
MTAPLGTPIADCDPLAWRVRRAIDQPELPAYLPRPHDDRLRATADEVLRTGTARIVTLVGGAATGKTRACWEVARYLDRRQPGRWRLWDPGEIPEWDHAGDAIANRVDGHTVMWIDEARYHLGFESSPVATGLLALLRRARPVLVLATMWPAHWDTLVQRAQPWSRVRAVLTGTAVPVPETFTATERAAAADGDPRLAEAAATATDGRVIQYLAGATGQEQRHRDAPPAARAILDAAVDACRVGHVPRFSTTLLRVAAAGYLDPEHRTATWFDDGLAYASEGHRGVDGPLTPVAPDGYLLADTLEENGPTGPYPPGTLWRAFVGPTTDPHLLHTLGRYAAAHGHPEHAVPLLAKASGAGHAAATALLADLRDRAGHHTLAEHLALRAGPDAVLALADRRYRSGDRDAARTLAAQATDTRVLRQVSWWHERDGDKAGADALLRQAADRGDAEAVRLRALRRHLDGDHDAAEALYRQAVDRGHAGALRELAAMRELAGDDVEAEALFRRGADAGDVRALGGLARLLDRAGDAEGARALALEAADRGDSMPLAALVSTRHHADDRDGALALALLAADRGDFRPLHTLADLRPDGEELLRLAADRGSVDALADLAALRRAAGDAVGADTYALRAAELGDAPT